MRTRVVDRRQHGNFPSRQFTHQWLKDWSMPDVLAPLHPVQVTAADTPGVQGLLTLAVAVVIVAGLYLGREVMIPIILAVLLSFLLAPVANFLRRLHLGRVPSALLAVVLALGIILVFGTVIGTQLAELAQEVPRYASSVERKIETLQSHRSATSQRSRVVSVMNSRTTVFAMNDAARRLSQLFLTQLAINAMFGVIIGTGLFVIGVPSPAALGCTRHAVALRALGSEPG